MVLQLTHISRLHSKTNENITVIVVNFFQQQKQQHQPIFKKLNLLNNSLKNEKMKKKTLCSRTIITLGTHFTDYSLKMYKVEQIR